ncbi:MAG: regulatory protein RecX [Candidatus Latescibacteria bacterium]|nr:regulatory protein RecX [Candidatus Latescibacterota bacterium]
MKPDRHPLVDDQAARLFAHDEAVEQAKNLAFRLLAARPRSRGEVIRRLRKRLFSPQAIEGAVGALERLGLLDDRAFARKWVEHRQTARPTGRQGLERELRDRWVAPDVVAEILDEMLADRDPEAEALDLLRTRVVRYRGLEREKALGRMYGLLSRRGFNAEVARAAARRMWQEMEDTRRQED